MQKNTFAFVTALAGLVVGTAPIAAQHRTPVKTPAGAPLSNTTEAPMLRGDTPATSAGWTVVPLFTVSETVNGYQPVGLLDGIGAFDGAGNNVDVLVNHELNPGNGYAYALANGTMLTGARVSRFVIGSTDKADARFVVLNVELAYDTIYDRSFKEVFDPAQINETGNGIDGIARAASSSPVPRT